MLFKRLKQQTQPNTLVDLRQLTPDKDNSKVKQMLNVIVKRKK